MKEEIGIRDTDYRVTHFGQKKAGMMVRSGFCWFVKKGVLEINNLVELWGSIIKWHLHTNLCYNPSLNQAVTATAKSLQLCSTLCDPIDGSLRGSPVPGILQARTLEWVAISLSNAWKWKVKGKSLSRVWLFATPWTEAYQAPPSMGFSRQEY